MYHIVYLTTNLVNSKFYVGVHSTYNLEDGYLGSGIAITKAITKYKRKNFKFTILHFCITAEHAYELESKIVDGYFINRPDTYNMKIGGCGGSNNSEAFIRYNKNKKGKTYEEMYGTEKALELKLNRAESNKKRTTSEKSKKCTSERFKGKSKSQSQKDKQSILMKNKTKIQCPHCNKFSDSGNYTRWHGDNCKLHH